MRRFLLIFVFCFALTSGSVVNNVRLVEPIPYMINVITETVQRVEDFEWCNLKVPDVTVDMNEVVFGESVAGKVSYKNGFVVSIRHVDILEHSLGQIWRFDNAANTTTVSITGTLRFSDVTVGFDVDVELAGSIKRYTAELVLPLVSFDMRVVRDMFTETVDVTVTPLTMSRNPNKMAFMPIDELTDIFSNLFDYTTITAGINIWASDILRPFALNTVAENVFEFPTICYNCPV